MLGFWVLGRWAAPVVTCCGAQQGDASASPLSFALDHSLLLLLVYSSLASDTRITNIHNFLLVENATFFLFFFFFQAYVVVDLNVMVFQFSP